MHNQTITAFTIQISINWFIRGLTDELRKIFSHYASFWRSVSDLLQDNELRYAPLRGPETLHRATFGSNQRRHIAEYLFTSMRRWPVIWRNESCASPTNMNSARKTSYCFQQPFTRYMRAWRQLSIRPARHKLSAVTNIRDTETTSFQLAYIRPALVFNTATTAVVVKIVCCSLILVCHIS